MNHFDLVLAILREVCFGFPVWSTHEGPIRGSGALPLLDAGLAWDYFIPPEVRHRIRRIHPTLDPPRVCRCSQPPGMSRTCSWCWLCSSHANAVQSFIFARFGDCTGKRRRLSISCVS